MKLSRQHLLLGVLIAMGLLQAGDWIITSMIQGPLQERRNRTNNLNKEITKREALLKQTRAATVRIAEWQKRSLPSEVDVARSVYRSWILEIIKAARLRNATVDSGAPSSRSGLYRSMPFTIRVRGSLAEFTDFLIRFTKADFLHQISSMSLSPISVSGQFDISLSIETLLLPGITRKKLNPGDSKLLAADDVREYDIIHRNNFFGIGIDTSDPMKTTLVTAITSVNGIPQAWITEQTRNLVTRVSPGDQFDTVALAGRVIEIHDQDIVIETSGEKLVLPIGKPFAEATPFSDK
jgi:preprotein translocase subunit YajC